MKKFIFFCFILLVPITCINAEEQVVDNIKEEVKLENCKSIDQIWVNKNNKVLRIGLLAYDPADTSINKVIQEYSCNKLKNASKIEIEYDKNNKVQDKYNRDMVWVYVDGNLLQEDLISNGYGMVNYVTDDFSYINNLCLKEIDAIKNKKGIWTLGVEEKYCKSGIVLDKEEKDIDNSNKEKKIDKKMLIKMIFITGVIAILLLTLTIKGKHEKER